MTVLDFFNTKKNSSVLFQRQDLFLKKWSSPYIMRKSTQT
jgi:hypothetical protein